MIQSPRTQNRHQADAERGATTTSGSSEPQRETARIGIYLSPQQFSEAKGAYLADWSNGGHADTFGRWIAAALDAYAEKTPGQRGGTAPTNQRSATRRGASRSFTIPVSVVDTMRTAIAADQHHGRWLSDSSWCCEAIEHATATAKARNGGVLPTPPARLPNRLARPSGPHS